MFIIPGKNFAVWTLVLMFYLESYLSSVRKEIKYLSLKISCKL